MIKISPGVQISERQECQIPRTVGLKVAGRSGGVGVEDIKHVYRLRDKMTTEGRLKTGIQIRHTCNTNLKWIKKTRYDKNNYFNAKNLQL